MGEQNEKIEIFYQHHKKKKERKILVFWVTTWVHLSDQN
jgi:hypothetical protein